MLPRNRAAEPGKAAMAGGSLVRARLDAELVDEYA